MGPLDDKKPLATPHPLDGAYAKLERAYENIRNLEREIGTFLEDGQASIGAYEDEATIKEAAKSHVGREIPTRFSILAGEIIHHLRSCLDHVAWQLSSPEFRSKNETVIEFPIFLREPVKKDELRRYKRKVEGISDAGRAVIESLQPYKRQPALMTGPESHALWLIHDMDRIDKHRELVITLPGFEFATTSGFADFLVNFYRHAGFPEEEMAAFGKSLDPKSQVTPQVAFRDFGGRKSKAVIPGLQKLANSVREVLAVFRENCF